MNKDVKNDMKSKKVLFIGGKTFNEKGAGKILLKSFL